MARHSDRVDWIMEHPLRFLGRVGVGFRNNQGFLLAGAVAYYTLLSIVPMFALLLVLLSQIIDTPLLLETTGAYLELLAPGKSSALSEHLTSFLDNWKLVGIAGFVVLLFFSSFAFTVLENAMSVIFFHRVRIQRRHFLISAILPYAYILLLAAGLLVVTAVSGWLHALEKHTLTVAGFAWSLDASWRWGIYILGVLGEVLLLTSLYLVMPVGRLAPSHALIGGVTATVLWEITRHVLIWYFTTLSFVNIIYGSFATVIVILLSLEAAAIILLLGAQVIAEYERIGTSHVGESGFQT